MPARIAPDQNAPCVVIEVPLGWPLPQYQLEQLEQPTPRQVDKLLGSEGFLRLLEDARGILSELLTKSRLEIAQFRGAICPASPEVYRPGLWIVLRDADAPPKQALSPALRQHVSAISAELVSRLKLE
jgi:hypothetical protein